MTRGWAMRKASTCGPARTRQRKGRVATTSAIGDSPRMIETSPKNSPRPSRAGQTLAEDLVALGEDRLLEQMDDAFELRTGEVREEREAGDRVNEFCPVDHALMVTEARDP